jgi:hypothetical protein
MFLLALSYHLGANTAAAQQGSPVVGFNTDNAASYVITPNGDVYSRRFPLESSVLEYRGNFWSGGATPALRESWGQVKARYRSNLASTTPGATDR